MTKYRIISNDKKYRVQKQILCIFWKTIKIMISYDYYDYVEFDSKKEAEEYIADIKANDLQRKMYKERKWKVIK